MKISRLMATCIVSAFVSFATFSAASAQTHGASAAGIWESGDTNYVSVGTGGGRSAAEAQNRAINSCQRNGGRNCRVVGNWSYGGCGYITVSTLANRGAVGWGNGPTKQAAYDSCYAQNNIRQCDINAIGFCSDRQ
ncbi:MAG TPA: DUF4189 domain-containing protein [Alphaproteobacteria bacterium]|nr:DUF4189 domain-containing protein [Alphaproteobacteria bacterium]